MLKFTTNNTLISAYILLSIIFLFEIQLLQGWRVYDTGPRSVETPLVFLHPVSGRAEVFFKQLLTLSSKGYRVISVRSINKFITN